MPKTARVDLPRSALEKGELPPVCVLTGAREGVQTQEVDLPVRPMSLALAEAGALGAAFLLGLGLGKALGLPGDQASAPAWLLTGLLAGADRLFVEGRWPRPWRVRLPVVPAALAEWRTRQGQARAGQAIAVLLCALTLGLGPFVLPSVRELAVLAGLPVVALGCAAWLQARAGSPRLALLALSPEQATLRLDAEPAEALKNFRPPGALAP